MYEVLNFRAISAASQSELRCIPLSTISLLITALHAAVKLGLLEPAQCGPTRVLLLVSCMTALDTEVVSELAAGFEGTIRVAAVVVGTAALSLIVLVRCMTPDDTKVVSKLAPRLEGTVGVTLQAVSNEGRQAQHPNTHTAVGATGGFVVSMASLGA